MSELKPQTERIVRGMDHVGLTVPDLEAATTFLIEALGAEVVYDVVTSETGSLKGEDNERQLGIPHGSEISKIRLLRIGDAPTIELFEFRRADQRDPVMISDFGWNHVCFYVDDIEAAAALFVAAGGTLLSPPHSIGGIEGAPRNRGFYGRPPWGGILEMLTYPDGIKYPDPARVRWTPPVR